MCSFCFSPRPADLKPEAAVRRSPSTLKGVEVSLDIKFRIASPGLLTQLETQLKIGTIATQAVAPDMSAGESHLDACFLTCSLAAFLDNNSL